MYFTDFMMVKWSCCSALCFNNHRTSDASGNKLKFYRLPRSTELQREYSRILQTTGINWNSAYICSQHWSKGFRENVDDLPDVPAHESQIERLRIKLEKARRRNNTSLVKVLSRKIDLTTRLSLKPFAIQRRTPSDRGSTPLAATPSSSFASGKARRPSYRQLAAELENLKLEHMKTVKELEDACKKIEMLEACNKQTTQAIRKLEEEKEELEDINGSLQTAVKKLRENEFSYTNVSSRPPLLKYLCGLDIEQFNIIYECVKPYLHLIEYPDCKGTGERSLDSATELLAVLTCCRHALHQGVMAYILRRSETTMQRIFIAWTVFLSTLFNSLDLRPANGYLLKMMPEIFIKTGHGLTDLVIDCTEFKCQQASNYDLNSLMFSDYKNATTGKALIGIAPHGSGIIFSDIYPGKISDSEITVETGAINLVDPEHELMSDRGFAISELCAEKGVYHNRPAMKMSDQFEPADVADNFDIAATRIHVERFIGRVRDWSILNSVWPLQRLDILNCTWQMLCHIVNIVMPPIGPKETQDQEEPQQE